MKNKVFTKITAMALALVMAVSPVTADAAEKKVVTNDDYKAVETEIFPDEVYDGYTGVNGDETWFAAQDAFYDYVKSLNGCYNEKGYKILTALDGTTKKLTKTGSYDIVVGGKTADTDQGYIKFVAPKSGTYKFTFTVKGTVTNNSVYIGCIDGNVTKSSDIKVNYTTLGGDKVTKGQYILLTPSGACQAPSHGSCTDWLSGNYVSSMKTISFTATMKKGHYMKFKCRDCGAAYDETDAQAYNFTDFNLTIKKTK